jgi:hypothetical protein
MSHAPGRGGGVDLPNSPSTNASEKLAAQATSMAESLLATPQLVGVEGVVGDLLDLKLSGHVCCLLVL